MAFLSLKSLTLLALALLSACNTANASPAARSLASRQAWCSTCNPAAGLNYCDVSTSCINTDPAGTFNYCACRAGYKAVLGAGDPSVQFRIPGAAFENRVFVPTGVACDTLCDDPFAGPGPYGLCSEVALTNCPE